MTNAGKPSKNPETNVHFLLGCLYRNWLWSGEMSKMIHNAETDANILYMQLREDLKALGFTLNEDEIRQDLSTISESCEAINDAIERLRLRDKVLERQL